MKSKLLNWLAIVFILQVGLIHFMNAQAEYEEAAYMGYLFVGNFLLSLLAAYGIYRLRLWGWLLGLLVAVGSIAGYSWSRTLGMPGMNVEEWFTPYGVVALSLEAILFLLFLFRPWKASPGEFLVPPSKVLLRLAPQVAGLLVIGLISIFTYRWDAAVTQAFGMHVGSVEQVSGMPTTSFAELEEQYGVQVSLVATSMMDSIVDVRLKIVDPDKAHALLQNQAALFADEQSLVLAPHMHSHNGGRLKPGKIFVIFFPTQQTIHTGSEVSLVFGSVRVEPVAVR